MSKQLPERPQCGDLVVCQGKGKPTYSEHCKQLKKNEKTIDVNFRFRIIEEGVHAFSES